MPGANTAGKPVAVVIGATSKWPVTLLEDLAGFDPASGIREA